jgi:hypothetical protein
MGFGGDWLFKRITLPQGKDAESYRQPICDRVSSLTELTGSVWLLANPRYVYYDSEIGLLLGEEGNCFQSPTKRDRAKVSEYRYRMDTYVGHLGNMWQCWQRTFSGTRIANGTPVATRYASVREELLAAGGRYLQKRIFPGMASQEATALFEYLVFLAIFTHDLGKLQVSWQKVVRGWQKYAHGEFGGQNPRSHLLAHTDYNPTDRQQRDAKGRTQKQAWQDYQKKYRRPPHAVESAYLAQEILAQSLWPVLRDRFGADEAQCWYLGYIIMLAAGRHHSAWARGWTSQDLASAGKLVLHSQAQEAIAQSWRRLVRDLRLVGKEANLSKREYRMREFLLTHLEEEQRTEYLQLYWLVVRGLRLCDGRSVSD